ncbi:hypothetical protein HY411_01610 [Candidatus Gottesmanbacteria bacterium]|nr:hypothetical protein [Candidatus Gottesmanbacteria bacterium]
MGNEAADTETVLEGHYTPRLVPPKKPDFLWQPPEEYRSSREVVLKPFTRLEFQEIPDNLLVDSDVIHRFTLGTSLPKNPRLGSWLISLINGMSDMGRVVQSEVSTALTMHRRRLYESSLHDISGGPRAAFSWGRRDALPRGHTLLASIHTHLPEEIVGKNPEGFSNSDFRGLFPIYTTHTAPLIAAVGTPEGIYTCLPPRNRSISWTLAEYLINHLNWDVIDFSQDSLGERLKNEMELIYNDLHGEDAWWKRQSMDRKGRLDFQKAFCERFNCKLYFTPNGQLEADRIV